MKIRSLADADLNKAIALSRIHKAGMRGAGVLLIPQTLDIGTAVEELLLVRLAREASEWEDRLEWLPL